MLIMTYQFFIINSLYTLPREKLFWVDWREERILSELKFNYNHTFSELTKPQKQTIK